MKKSDFLKVLGVVAAVTACAGAASASERDIDGAQAPPSSPLSAPKLSPTQAQKLAGYLRSAISGCWKLPGIVASLAPEKKPISVTLRIMLNRDGSLNGTPQMTRIEGPAKIQDILTQSAVHAVRRCTPLEVPAEFNEFYDSWRSIRIRFAAP